MIINTALGFWNFTKSFRAAGTPESLRGLLLNGEALIMLQTLESPAVEKALCSFIATECFVRNIADKSAHFVRS